MIGEVAQSAYRVNGSAGASPWQPVRGGAAALKRLSHRRRNSIGELSMNTIAVFPDLASVSKQSARAISSPAPAVEGGPELPPPPVREVPAIPPPPTRSTLPAKPARVRKDGRRRVKPRPVPRLQAAATAPFRGQWASVSVLAVLAAAVWSVVVYVEGQPLPGSGQQAAAAAAVYVAADPPSTAPTAETRRQ